MCVTPSNLPTGETVACRKCWQCIENRKNDYVGRCIAEQRASTSVIAVTLTYSGDTPNAATLVYADFQKFMKRLRHHGYNVRYIVAGEYGKAKGRAHWHAVLFFKGKAPEVTIERRVNWDMWPDGFSYFQEPSYDGLRYVIKYALKEAGGAMYGHLAMSKKPPLGHDYFMELAEKHVDAGLSPQTFKYGWKDVRNHKGEMREFMLQGKSRENYLRHYLETWCQIKGTAHPLSELIEEYFANEVQFEGPTTHYEWEEYWRKNLVYPDGPDIHRSYYDAEVAKTEERRVLALYNGVPIKIFVGDYGDMMVQDMEGWIWHARKPEEIAELKRGMSRVDRAQLLRVRREARAGTLLDMTGSHRLHRAQDLWGAELPPWLRPTF